MPKKPKPKAVRQVAPLALEFQVARAAVEFEKACRQLDYVVMSDDKRRNRMALHKHDRTLNELRRTASMLIDK